MKRERCGIEKKFYTTITSMAVNKSKKFKISSIKKNLFYFGL